MSLQDELTETTVEDKLRRLASFFTSTPFEDITMSFNLKTDIDNSTPELFNEMMAGALTYHFNVETEPTAIEALSTLGDLAELVHSRSGS